MAGSSVRPPGAAGSRLVLSLTAALWLGLAAATAGRTLVNPRAHCLFPLFAASSTHWWADQPLYAPYPPLDQFRYPPTFAVAVTPFAALGLRVGGVLWVWAGMAVYGAGLWRFGRDVVPGRWEPAQIVALLGLGAVVALPGIWNGQSNVLAVGLLLLAASALVRERWWVAAALLAAAVWAKLTPLAPALLLCALRPARLGPRFAAALALGALLPFLTRPPGLVAQRYAEWLGQLLHTGGVRWPGFRDGWTVWVAALHPFRWPAGRLLFPTAGGAACYRALQLLSAAGALAWCLWQQARGASPRWLCCATLGMGTAWLMLFGPAVEHATYAFLGPSLAWAVLEREEWPRGRWLIGTAFVLVAVLGWDDLTRRLLGDLPLLTVALPLGTLLFTVWLVGYGWSSRQTPWRGYYTGTGRARPAYKTPSSSPPQPQQP
ncbi:MAG TPA: glycosyltransferase 87 family protein, partial [Gemmataceae bacterium]|nr:glycosyltransferase 87 family protein [Gemmataceae bacterium]